MTNFQLQVAHIVDFAMLIPLVDGLVSLFLLLLLNLFLLIPSSTSTIYRLHEERPPMTFIGDLLKDTAMSRRNGSQQQHPANISFVFLNENSNHHTSLFHLESSTGVLRTAAVLDRDAICPKAVSCQMNLDVGTQPAKHFHAFKVTVELLDLNDNPPKFAKPLLAVSVSESTVPGVLFPVPSAEDLDSPTYGVMRYQLVSNTRVFGLQTQRSGHVETEPSLVLLDSLDREKMAFYQLKIIAYDGGYPQMSGSLLLEVTVQDANDNSPRFTSDTYRTEVDENSPPVRSLVVVSATDQDAGNNGAVQYYFSARTDAQHSGVFSVDAESGVISVLQPLDYEEQTSVTLEVIAKDHGEGSIPATCHVVIDIHDVNDNEPDIRLEAEGEAANGGALRMTEHSPVGLFLAQVSVFDPDSGLNGQVQCSVRTPGFQLEQIIEGTYKLLTARSFDRELSDRQRLTIICQDLGQPTRSSVASLDVHIDDINDHAPVFSHSSYNFTISENERPKSWIGRVTATDPDVGPNGEIRYSLYEDAGDFVSVDSKSGVLTTAVSFDHETADGLQFHVVASDQGVSPLSSRVLVTVNIRNTDDEAPVFSQNPYVFYVQENRPSRTSIGWVMATDKDLPPFNRVVYAAEDGDTDSFEVDHTTGTIYTKRKLDREEQEVMWLIVVAKSQSNPSRFDAANVTVWIEDINDNPPIVLFPVPDNNTVHVTVDAPVGHLVTTVVATDDDAGENGHVTYAIAAGSEQKEFAVDAATGKIYVSAPLGRLPEGTRLPLLLEIRDGGNPMKQTLADLSVIVTKAGMSEVLAHGPGGLSRSAFTSRALIAIGVTSGLLLIAIVLPVVILSCRWRRNRRKREKGVDGIRSPTEEVVHANADLVKNLRGTTPGNTCVQFDEDDEEDLPISNNYMNEMALNSPQVDYYYYS